MTKHRKRSVRDYITEVSPYELETTLGDLQARIQQWIDDHGPDARLDWDAYFHHDYESTPSPRFNLVKDREETDREFEERIGKEKKDQEERETRERAEFERLSAKFGKK